MLKFSHGNYPSKSTRMNKIIKEVSTIFGVSEKVTKIKLETHWHKKNSLFEIT